MSTMKPTSIIELVIAKGGSGKSTHNTNDETAALAT
jgi:hypothetical protein